MKKLFLVLMVLALAVPGFSLFRAGDIVFVLAAANVAGANNTYWNTDLWVTNPNAADLYLTIEYLPSGLPGNAVNRIYLNWSNPIKPNETLYIQNILANQFSSYFGFGALVLYGEYIDGTAANLLAQSRTYTPMDTTDLSKGNYGQGVPGIPWYYYVDPDYSIDKLDAHWIFGLDQAPLSATDKYRSNVGFVNGSQSTTLNLKLELYDSAGTKVGEETVQGLGPLAHYQINGVLDTTFHITEGTNYALKVTIASSSPENPTFPPALFVYGSKASNGTGDPTYLEATYSVPLDYSCVWP